MRTGVCLFRPLRTHLGVGFVRKCLHLCLPPSSGGEADFASPVSLPGKGSGNRGRTRETRRTEGWGACGGFVGLTGAGPRRPRAPPYLQGLGLVGVGAPGWGLPGKIAFPAQALSGGIWHPLRPGRCVEPGVITRPGASISQRAPSAPSAAPDPLHAARVGAAASWSQAVGQLSHSRPASARVRRGTGCRGTVSLRVIVSPKAVSSGQQALPEGSPSPGAGEQAASCPGSPPLPPAPAATSSSLVRWRVARAPRAPREGAERWRFFRTPPLSCPCLRTRGSSPWLPPAQNCPEKEAFFSFPSPKWLTLRSAVLRDRALPRPRLFQEEMEPSVMGQEALVLHQELPLGWSWKGTR